MWLSTLIVAPLAVLTFPFPFVKRYAFITQWARFNLWWLRLTCRLTYRVQGRNNIPAGNAIVFCKHQSAWETLALQSIFPPQIWLLKRELLWIPFFGWGLAMLEPIAIDRSAGRKAIEQLVRQGKERLAAGRWVIIFPEGTRMAPGQTGRYGIGGAVLAAASGYPVVPVAHNAGEFWPRRGFIKRPGTITVSIGPVVETRGKDAEMIREEARAWIEHESREISSLR
jgi:1-acyl-sn-glycerol-3-phosphate acyltransferase